MLAVPANGFTSNADDMVVSWEEANHNPIFQFMEQRADIRMGATLVDMMAKSLNLVFHSMEKKMLMEITEVQLLVLRMKLHHIRENILQVHQHQQQLCHMPN